MFGSYNDALGIIQNYITQHNDPKIVRELENVLALIHDAREVERRQFEQEQFCSRCDAIAFEISDSEFVY